MIFEETYKMNNGIQIPKLALGTWLIENEKAALEFYWRIMTLCGKIYIRL